jgi:hypothetical protein
MPEKHLTMAIAQRLATLNRKERVAKVRKLASASAEDEKFIRETFPALYRETFRTPHRAAGASR